MRRSLGRMRWVVGVLGGIYLAGFAWTADETMNADREEIEASAVKFVEAYNERKLDDLLDLFAPDADLLPLDAEPLSGRDALRDLFTAGFGARPKAKISLSVESLRFVTPDVAFEDGTTTSFADGETATSRSRYSLVHVKRDGRWRMKLVRELEEEPLSPYARLQDLEWMLGDWIDEGSDAVVSTSCKWDENKSFLLRDFEVKTQGDVVLKGQQRIGWDPIAKQVRSWVFDNSGGFGEALWTPFEDRWVIKSTGVRPDGKSASATQTVTLLAEGRMEWQTDQRIVGDEELPAFSVTLVRRPPAPATADAK
jgi:uncharacterized protein (TIGR02246 family)